MLGHFGFLAATGTYTAAYRVLNAANTPAYALYSSAFPRFFRLGAKGAEETARAGPGGLRFGPRLSSCCWRLCCSWWHPTRRACSAPGFAETALALRWLCLLPFLRAMQWSAGDALSGVGEQRLRLALQAAAPCCSISASIFGSFRITPGVALRGPRC